MDKKIFILKALRRMYSIAHSMCYSPKMAEDAYEAQLYEEYVQYFDQDANELVRDLLLKGNPCMIAKFGTVELSALVNYLSLLQEHYSVPDLIRYIKGDRKFLWWNDSLKWLCSNAGFFPYDERLFNDFCELYIKDIKEIDIIGSYLKEENYFDTELAKAIHINIDGYYAPFYYNNPWTGVLKGKTVLVIHPFENSIKNQYVLREKIWSNPSVLPEFDLKTIRAVQTIAGERCEFVNWFEALNSMKENISNLSFDIALIGCGAYGLPLSAHVKRIGKQAVHLAGWLQTLFGIKGQRWIDDPRVAKYMNSYWAHPLQSEVPKNYKTIENGCYW